MQNYTTTDAIVQAPVQYQASPSRLSRTVITIEHVRDIVLGGVSKSTRRDYGRALNDFIVWWNFSGRPALSRSTVQAHVVALKEHGVPAASINQRLAAIRKLSSEAVEQGLIDDSTGQAIGRIQNERTSGKRLGNWLSRDQASAMLNEPERDTLKGLRDRAVLAVAVGCGLRRSEIVALTVDHIAMREGRWVILDLVGKHNHVRSVPMPAWVKVIVDRWLQSAGISEGLLFRRMLRGDHVVYEEGISSQTVWDIVGEYAPVDNLAPHDLRRTFAKLARKAGAPIEQIQLNLGHQQLTTTQAYLGMELDLALAPGDLIKLDIE
jgi:site-specific recombinase XerD